MKENLAIEIPKSFYERAAFICKPASILTEKSTFFSKHAILQCCSIMKILSLISVKNARLFPNIFAAT